MGVTFYTMFESNCLTFFIRTGCPVQLQSNSIGHILSSQSFHINSHAWRQNIASHIYRYRYFTYYRCLATRTYLKNFSWRMVLELPEHILHTVPIGVHIARHPYLSSNYIGWYMYWYVIIFQLLNHPVSSHILPHVGYILKISSHVGYILKISSDRSHLNIWWTTPGMKVSSFTSKFFIKIKLHATNNTLENE